MIIFSTDGGNVVDLLIRVTAKFRPGGSRVHLGQVVPLLVEGWKQNRDSGGRTNIRDFHFCFLDPAESSLYTEPEPRPGSVLGGPGASPDHSSTMGGFSDLC